LLPPSPSLVWSYNYVLPLPPPTERKKENSGCCLSAKYELVVLQHSFPVGKLAGLCTLGFVFSRGVGFSQSGREIAGESVWKLSELCRFSDISLEI